MAVLPQWRTAALLLYTLQVRWEEEEEEEEVEDEEEEEKKEEPKLWEVY